MNPGNCPVQTRLLPWNAWVHPVARTLAGHVSSAHRDAMPLAVMELIAQLQSCTAAQVDAGLDCCLLGLLRMTQAQSVRWTLLDGTLAGPAICVATTLTGARLSCRGADGTVGMRSVVDHLVRPGRVMSFEFSWEVARPADLSLLTLILAGVSRWLNWLDLSHGPLNEQGVMPACHRRVLLQLLTGLSEKQIPHQLDLSANTVHRYVTAIYRRYGVRNRASLLARWMDAMR